MVLARWKPAFFVGCLVGYLSQALPEKYSRRDIPDVVKVSSEDSPATEPKWSCHVFDQLSYCVYYNSLCLDKDGSIVLLTRNTTKHDHRVDLINDMSPSPWHAPDLNAIGRTSYGRYDVPFRSFFTSAKYSSSPINGGRLKQGWSLVAAFDATNYNIYHYMNTMHASFIARMYELGGLKDRSVTSSNDFLQDMISPLSEFDFAYLLRPQPTSWQKNYGELCLGSQTKAKYIPHFPSNEHVDGECFEKAIIPGAALYLAEGLASSTLFREMAARVKQIRVPEEERNLITIFERDMGDRNILNVDELIQAVQIAAPTFKVVSVIWDGQVDFKTQALHMARTRVMISTHGSVLNHNVFMEAAGVVIEVNGYQFSYPLDNQVVLSRGNHYIRYEETLQNTKHQGFELGHDPFPGVSTRQCMAKADCILARRDVDIKVNLDNFIPRFEEGLSLVT